MKRFLLILLILILSLSAALADPLPMLEDYAEDIVIPYDESDPSAGVFSYSYRYPHVDEMQMAARESMCFFLNCWTTRTNSLFR